MCPEIIVELVRRGQVPEARLDQSVRRLLREKFVLGLFDHRYVDPDTAEDAVGCGDFQAAGVTAERRSVTLLTNSPPGCVAHLPLSAGLRVYTENIGSDVAARYFSVVERIEDADVAILRLEAPYERRAGQFAAFFHAGSLEFPADDLARILAIINRIPTIVDVYLDRPAVIPLLAERAGALVATFAVGDEAFLDVLCGRATPGGQLPFDLPRSMAAVTASATDVAFDSEDPVFRYGHGLRY